MKKTPIILICAAIMALPAAHAEPSVTVLPTVAPDAVITVDSNPYVLDLSGYYASDTVMYQTPSLTEAEKARVPEIRARYDAGERPAGSALDRMENVVVGVYPLVAEDYRGESVFVLLPFRELTDEELLCIIDAYARLGFNFDAEGLGWRNCMRGGGVECNRTYAGDEYERVDVLTDLYKRQGLRPKQPYTVIPGDDGIGEIMLNEDEYSGLDRFRLFPCRRMTDEELLRLIQNRIGENIPDTAVLSRYERQARAQLTALFGAPLSVRLTGDSVGKAGESSIFDDDREVYRCGFKSADETLSYAMTLDTTTGLFYHANVSLARYDSLAYSDLRCDPFDEKWPDIAREAVTAMRADNVEIVSVESFGEDELQCGGFCACVTVTMADGSAYELRIPFQTEQASDFEYRQIPVTPEQHALLYN